MLRTIRRCWHAFTDPQTPFVAKAAVIIAALYGLTPFDFIPDVLPVLGQLDDLAVVLVAGLIFWKLAWQQRS